MYYALYLEDGTLVGVTNETPVSLHGVSVKQLDQSPDLEHFSWDKEQLEFIRQSTFYTRLEFMTKFTHSERVAARASDDPIVQDFLQLLSIASFIDTTDPNTVAGVNYLVYKGILTQARATEILQ